MAWLNIITIPLLLNVYMKCFKDYEKQMKVRITREERIFDLIKLGIKNDDFWKKVKKGSNK